MSLRRLAFFGMSAAVAVSLLPAISGAQGAAPVAAAAEVPTPVVERPDRWSASLAAAGQGSRVEVAGDRSETSRTWANPDGSFTAELATGVQRVQAADGSWREVDLTLASSGGKVAPRVGAVDLVLSAGGTGSVVSLSDPRSSLAVQVGAGGLTLPEPTLAENVATYADVRPGVDLRVTAMRAGYEIDFIIKTKPTSPLSFNLPVTVAGAVVKPGADGSLALTDGKGKLLGFGGAPLMWDATMDERTAQPARSTLVPTVVAAPKALASALTMATGEKVAAGDAVTSAYTLSPDAAWLADPATTYPVTVDPWVNVAGNGDTYVKNTTATTSYWSNGFLYIGTPDSGTTKYRSFLMFPIPAQVKDPSNYVTEAHLNLWNSYSATCTAANAPVYPWSAADNIGASTTWNTQPDPGAVSDPAAYFAVNANSGSCDSTSYQNVPVTTIVRGWAGSGLVSKTIRLTSLESGAGSATGYKQFWSGNNGSQTPALYVTYDVRPNAPYGVLAMPGVGSFVNTVTPTFSARLNDADAQSLTATYTVKQGSTTVWSGSTSPAVAAGQRARLVMPSGVLANGTTYTVTAKANDGVADSQTTTTATYTVDTAAPSAPTVACSGYPSGSWTTTSTALACTGTVSGDGTVTSLEWTLDGGAGGSGTTAVTGGSGTATMPVGAGKAATAGWHTVTVRAVDRAGNTSGYSTYTFGAGAAGLSQPVPLEANAALAVTYQAPLQVTASSGVEAVIEYWDDTVTPAVWVPVPAAALTAGATGTGAGANPVALTTSGAAKVSAVQRWSLGSTITRDKAVKIHACIHATVGATTCASTTPETVLAFDRVGAAGASTSLGPASVSLTSGDLSVSAQGASLPVWSGDIGIGLSYHTGFGNTDTGFGKGWTAGLPAMDGTDWSRIDDAGDYALLYGGDGTAPLAFTKSPGGSYASPADAGDLTLVRTGSGTGTTWTLTDLVDSVAVFNGGTGAAGTPTAPVAYPASTVTTPGAGATAYTYASGRVSRVTALPPGVTTSDCPEANTSVWIAGCSDLKPGWATTGSGGDAKTRLTTVTLRIWDPATSSVKSADAACYSYDSTGHLVSAWDPREGDSTPSCSDTPVLVTGYSYTSDRLTGIAPPGTTAVPPTMAGWVFGYDGSARAVSATRTHTGGSYGTGSETTSIVYDAPIGAVTYTGGPVAGTSTDATHPDLSAARAAAWGQSDLAVRAAAVFPPGVTVSSTDLRGAAVTAFNAEGQTVNTAVYSGDGQAGWKVTTSEHDARGAAVRSLTAANRDRALAAAGPNPGDPVYAAYPAGMREDLTDLGLIGKTTSEVAAALDSRTVYSPDGLDVTDTYGPARRAILSGAGDAAVVVRDHTTTTYGTLATPGADKLVGGPEHQPVTVTTGVQASTTPGGAADADTTVTRYQYALTSSASGDDAAGWTLQKPMRVIQVVDGGSADVIRETKLSASTGQVLEQRQPSATGVSADPGTRVSQYYIVGAHNPSGCTSTAWYGRLCKTKPGSQPGTGPQLVETTYSYDILGRPTTVTEAITGQTSRVSTTTYGSGGWSGRATVSSITGGLGATVPSTTTGYSSSTGLPTSVTGNSVTSTVGYDDFGRPVSATDGRGGTVTTSYDANGRVGTTTFIDGSTTVATTTYGYDGTLPTGAGWPAGGTERRGLPTSVTHSGWGAVTAAYDPDGTPVYSGLPGGIESRTGTDPTGDPTDLTWSKSGVVWVADAQVSDATGRWATESATGAGWTSRSYDYDKLGRLTQTTEANPYDRCRIRTYSYTGTYGKNSNRYGRTEYASDTATSTCQATTAIPGWGSQTLAYDNADRITSAGSATGIVYDAWGRVTTLPAALTAPGQAALAGGPATSNATMTYRADDRATSITQTVAGTSTIQEIGWNPTGGDGIACRRTRPAATSDATVCGSTVTAGVTDVTERFTGGDSPAWSLTKTGPTAATVNRWLAGPAGGLLAQGAQTLTSGATPTVTVQLTGLHGDILRTTTPGATGSPDGAATLVDETGQTRDLDTVEPAAANQRYGWLGAQQRAADTPAGLTLMGIRLYNPITGSFLSTDPVYGGNHTSYGYPADPIGGLDLDGRRNDRQAGVKEYVFCNDKCMRKIRAARRAYKAAARTAVRNRADAIARRIAAGVSSERFYGGVVFNYTRDASLAFAESMVDTEWSSPIRAAILSAAIGAALSLVLGGTVGGLMGLALGLQEALWQASAARVRSESVCLQVISAGRSMTVGTTSC